MRGQLIILCTEEDYALQLMEFMKERKEFPFMISVFSDIEPLLNYTEGEEVEILLYSGNYTEEVLGQISSKLKIELRESSIDADEVEHGTYSIFKYQSADRILREIIHIFEQKNGILIKEKSTEENTITVVYSSTEDELATCLASALAHEYARTKRTLFLSFSPLIRRKLIGHVGSEKGISDLIYYGKQWDEYSLKRIKLLIQSNDSFDFIIGVYHWSDISEFTEEEAFLVLNEMKKGLPYEVIVIDVGMLSNSSSAVFRIATDIYEVISEKDDQKERSLEFRRQLEQKEGVAVVNKIKEVDQRRHRQKEGYIVHLQEEKNSSMAKELINRRESTNEGGTYK